MATAEERMQVLRMIENGTVNAAEGARLLDALGQDIPSQPATPPPPPVVHPAAPRRFHIRVTDLTTGKAKVDVNLPWSLVSVGINMGARFAPRDIDIEQMMQTIDSSTSGKVMDIVDEEDSERVEIFVE